MVLCKPVPFSDPSHYYHRARQIAEATPAAFWGNQASGRSKKNPSGTLRYSMSLHGTSWALKQTVLKHGPAGPPDSMTVVPHGPPAVSYDAIWLRFVPRGSVCSDTRRHSMAQWLCSSRTSRTSRHTTRAPVQRSGNRPAARRAPAPAVRPAPCAVRAAQHSAVQASFRLEHAALACCILHGMLHHRAGGCFCCMILLYGVLVTTVP